MMPLIETALAFVAAMLAASLLVNGGVQVLLTLGRYRMRTVKDVLSSVIHGFRFYYNDRSMVPADPQRMNPVDPETARKSTDAFIEEVLRDPTIQTRGSKNRYSEDPTNVETLVEYVAGDDLIELAYNHAEYERTHPLPAGVQEAPIPSSRELARKGPPLQLPAAWFDGKKPAYATAQNFEAYVQRWFKTLDATASQTYKGRSRQLTLLVSAITVVLLNFDSFNLMRALYANSSARDSLAAAAPALQKQVKALPSAEAPVNESVPVATAAPSPSDEMRLGLVTLDAPGLGIGWQDSWIIQRFCARTHTCGPKVPAAAGERLWLDVLSWIGGLLTSCLFLSFGAPFWYGMLQNVLNLKNQLARVSNDPTAEGRPRTDAAPPG